MPTVNARIARQLALLVLSASLSACAALPRPQAVVLPPVAQPLAAELMKPEPSEDYSQRVQSWLQRVADALERLQQK